MLTSEGSEVARCKKGWRDGSWGNRWCRWRGSWACPVPSPSPGSAASRLGPEVCRGQRVAGQVSVQHVWKGVDKIRRVVSPATPPTSQEGRGSPGVGWGGVGSFSPCDSGSVPGTSRLGQVRVTRAWLWLLIGNRVAGLGMVVCVGFPFSRGNPGRLLGGGAASIKGEQELVREGPEDAGCFWKVL